MRFPELNVAIDIGNSSIKVAFFMNGQLVNNFHVNGEDETYDLIQQYKPANGIICSVSKDPLSIQNTLESVLPAIYILNYQLPIPLNNLYETPHTLGMDRLAAIIGARHLYPDSGCLVIDLGTCITYDFASVENTYWGGSISPGLRMRFKALHSFTSRLPLIEPKPEVPLIGSNTHDAILSGVIHGMTMEIAGIIDEYHKKFGNFHVIFCGGDANFFESKIKESIFVIPELVPIGLNRILEYNVLEV